MRKRTNNLAAIWGLLGLLVCVFAGTTVLSAFLCMFPGIIRRSFLITAMGLIAGFAIDLGVRSLWKDIVQYRHADMMLESPYLLFVLPPGTCREVFVRNPLIS